MAATEPRWYTLPEPRWRWDGLRCCGTERPNIGLAEEKRDGARLRRPSGVRSMVLIRGATHTRVVWFAGVRRVPLGCYGSTATTPIVNLLCLVFLVVCRCASLLVLIGCLACLDVVRTFLAGANLN